MRGAIEAGVIQPSDRFTLHGLKHRGVTDTKGSRQQKQRASGHRTESMVALYDHDVPVVQPATPREDASFRESFRELAISAKDENAKSQNLKQESGGPYRTRTYNQLIKSQLLYQLS